MTSKPVDPVTQFALERDEEIARQGQDNELRDLSRRWFDASIKTRYSYHFEWMGRPIIQYPQDVVAMQEILWRTKPDLVIETGIAHGGSIVFYASILELIGNGSVLGIDVDIRSHNRAAIESHPMMKRVRLLEGSSIAPEIAAEVQREAAGKRVLVVLDSNHTHDHVRMELELYAPLVSVGSYCVVMDTVVEDIPPAAIQSRPWARGNNPKTAVLDYLKAHPEFEIDAAMDHKLLLSVAPSGYLIRSR